MQRVLALLQRDHGPRVLAHGHQAIPLDPLGVFLALLVLLADPGAVAPDAVVDAVLEHGEVALARRSANPNGVVAVSVDLKGNPQLGWLVIACGELVQRLVALARHMLSHLLNTGHVGKRKAGDDPARQRGRPDRQHRRRSRLIAPVVHDRHDVGVRLPRAQVVVQPLLPAGRAHQKLLRRLHARAASPIELVMTEFRIGRRLPGEPRFKVPRLLRRKTRRRVRRRGVDIPALAFRGKGEVVCQQEAVDAQALAAARNAQRRPARL